MFNESRTVKTFGQSVFVQPPKQREYAAVSWKTRHAKTSLQTGIILYDTTVFTKPLPKDQMYAWYSRITFCTNATDALSLARTDVSMVHLKQKCCSRKYRVIRNDCRGLTTFHLVLQMQPHMIYFYGVTSRIRFMFLLFPQISRNWRYQSEPPLKPSPLTCYRQFGTNSIIVLMFVESQRVHI